METGNNNKIIMIVGVVVVVCLVLFFIFNPFKKPESVGEKTFSGVVLEKRGDGTLIIDALSLRGAKNLPIEQILREVRVTEKTEFFGERQKDPAVFMKEMEEFTAKQGNPAMASDTLLPPVPFISEKISLDLVKVKSNVTIVTEEDVIENEKLSARSIKLNDPIIASVDVGELSSAPNFSLSGEFEFLEGENVVIKSVTGQQVRVVLHENIQIFKKIKKLRSDYQKELLEYEKMSDETKRAITPPRDFTEEIFSVEQIKPGMFLEIQGNGNEALGVLARKIIVSPIASLQETN